MEDKKPEILECVFIIVKIFLLVKQREFSLNLLIREIEQIYGIYLNYEFNNVKNFHQEILSDIKYFLFLKTLKR